MSGKVIFLCLHAHEYISLKRGAVKIWKPKVTPMSDLRPAQMNTIKTATGDEVQTMQKTSLTRENQPVSVQYVALSTKALWLLLFL